MDSLDHGAERREVLDAVDRDELTGDLVGHQAALLDVTTPLGLDVLSTIGHGLDCLRGLLLHADGRRRLVSIVAGSGTIIDPVPATSEFDVQGHRVLGSEPIGDVRDPELDADPALVLTAAVGLPVSEVGTLADAVAQIDDVLGPQLGIDICVYSYTNRPICHGLVDTHAQSLRITDKKLHPLKPRNQVS